MNAVEPDPLPPTPDLALFARWVARRDEAAVAVLWTRYHRLGAHLAGRVLASQPDANEVALEVCDDAFVQALQTFQPKRAPAIDAPFRAWFLRLCRQRAIDRLRAAPPPGSSDVVLFAAARQERQLAAVRDLDRLRRWVLAHALPSDWVAIERRGEGHAWEELAAQIRIDPPTPVACAAGALPADGAWGDVAAGLLAAAPALCLRVVGLQTADGQDGADGLGLRRAREVRRLLVARAPSVASRLRCAAEDDVAGCAVRFEVIGGATRSAAAWRVRHQALVRRYLADVEVRA